MVRRTKAEAEATREAMLDAAEAVFLEQGVSGATLEQIARRAGLTRGAFYWHFKNKAELLLAMRQRVDDPMWEWFGQRREELSDDPIGLMQEGCRRVLCRMQSDARYRNVHAIFLTRCEMTDATLSEYGRIFESEDEHFDVIEADFDRARALGQVRSDVSPRVAALGLYSLMQGICLGWLRSTERFDITADGSTMLAAYFRGLEPDRGAASVGAAS